MRLLLSLACCLLALPAAAPSTRINVQLDPSRPTQLYRAPGGDGGAGAWIITASGPRRPAQRPPQAGTPASRPGLGQRTRPVYQRPSSAQAGSSGNVASWTRHGGVAAVSKMPNKPRPSADAGAADWTQHNSVEGATGVANVRNKQRPSAFVSNIKLPSFVITSRPFGFKGSSKPGQGQRRPSIQSVTWGPGHASSGQGHASPSSGQSRPSVSGYVRPGQVRPSAVHEHSRPSSDSFIFPNDPKRRPNAPDNRESSRPTTDDKPTNDVSPSRLSVINPQPSSIPSSQGPSATNENSVSRPSQVNSALISSADVSSDLPSISEAGTMSSEPEPLAAPPVASSTSVTRKTTPDTVSAVGGKKLPTFNVGCRQGRRCSFIISVPTRVPEPTYTPYDKQTVDNYLQRFQSMLALSNTKQGAAGTSSSASTSAGTASASASDRTASATSTSAGAASATYTTGAATAVPSPGEAYRQDIRQAASAPRPAVTLPDVPSVVGGAAKPHTAPAGGPRPSAAWSPHQAPARPGTVQRYRPGTADLYRLLRASPLTTRPARPGHSAPASGHWAERGGGAPEASPSQADEWSPVSYRQAKNVGNGEVPSEGSDQRFVVTGNDRPAGQRWSQYTVEKVDPLTKKTYPTAWNSATSDSSNVIPVSGKIFKAHLSSGPITFQSRGAAKQSRSEVSFKHSSAQNIPKTASIITEDGVRELPNVLSLGSMHRASRARHSHTQARNQHRLQMAREMPHYAPLPSQARSAWRWSGATPISRRFQQ